MEKKTGVLKALMNNIKRVSIIFISLILVTVACFLFLEKIPNGYVGVQYSVNGGVKNEILTQGVKFVGFNKVTEYPIRLQTVTADSLNLATQDGKATNVSISYSYKVDPSKVSSIYKEFGSVSTDDIEATWLKSQLLKTSRAVVSRYNLLNVSGRESTKVQSEILQNFQEAVKNKGFIIEDLSFGVPDVDEETKKSIDAIIKAGQDNERAKLEAETAKTEAEGKAKAKMIEAEAEAKANDLKTKSLTDEILKDKELDARMKHGWLTTQAGQAIVDTTKNSK
ncbi:prohibitin family protein [Brochothrix thermosphacta]|uniref:prohibitin family protein n=1 Tax=Brochothrix thermosphacta TaxID=2756 RepID=UPI000D2DC1A3|nr:prohibitin family protein [Brochothrix thermosphacta]SOC29535.1 SPFH/Band 7/PHB domain protein [Brochothrix thermosphacta]